MNPRRILFLASLAVLAFAPTLAAAQGAAAAAADNPDLAEARNYTLTMDKLRTLADATDAVNKLLASNAALKARVDAGSSGNLPLDQQAKKMDADFPQIAAIIHAHGITTRDYILISIAFMNDVTFVGMKRQGMIQAYPPNSVTPQNAAFVEANWDKLQALGQRMTPQNQN